MQGAVRYFLAITPEPGVRGQIEGLRTSWGSPHHKVEPHITVKAPFSWTGDPEVWLAPVRAALAGVGRFPLKLGAPGSFGGQNVLFLTVPSDRPAQVHQAVVSLLYPLLPPDPRVHEGGEYHPHLTMAVKRFGARPELWPQYEREARALAEQLPEFLVGSVRVYEWRGTRWETLVDLPLGRGKE